MNTPSIPLSSDDMHDCSAQLDTALDNHSKWLARLHNTIACHGTPDPADLAEDAHQCCAFGKWYHGAPHPALKQFPDFIAIGDIHQQLHTRAREALTYFTSHGECDHNGGHFAALLDASNELRKRMYHLGMDLARDFGQIAKVADRIFQHAAEGVMVTDPQGRILNVNEAFTEVTGYSRSDVTGNTPALLKSGRQGPAFYKTMWQNLEKTGHWAGEIWNRRKSGDIYLEWLSISAVRNRDGIITHFVGIFSDITKSKQDEERLHHLAHYDALTGLPNRLLFHDRLQQALNRASRNRKTVAVMLLDLDRFKIINDTLGHDAGDILLVSMAQRLSGCLRDSDTVARMGGDEFIVVLPDLDDGKDSAKQVAQKIIDSLLFPFVIGGQELFVTTSIGISLFPADGMDTETLTKCADIAMYQAKEQGRNDYQFYHSQGHAATEAQFSLEHGLRRALENNELELYYQPQVDIETGIITGMEALMRWRHPERGMIMPGDFIPVAEETGLILPIGEWALRQACIQNMIWQNAGIPPLRMSVNVSVRQLRQRTLAEKVAEILDETGMDADWLELEVTESMVMQNAEMTLGLLHQLKSIGVWLAIDDFGTGYSNLSYLKRFPIDTLKIDKSFVSEIPHKEDDAAIAKSIIALADILHLKVIAEGVETQPQLDFLREHQCCDAQGYYFSRPLPAEEITRMLEKTRQLGMDHAA